MALFLIHKQIKFNVGDTIKVHQKIVEGGKERIQAFEGLVISIKGDQAEKTFTVRKVTGGFGVERIWPVDSPFIKEIEVINKGNVKRAKLYYLRNRIGRLALKVKTNYSSNGKNLVTKTKTTKPAIKSKETGTNGRADNQEVSTK